MADGEMNVSTGLIAGVNDFLYGNSSGKHGNRISFKDILRSTPLFNLDSTLQARAGSSNATASTCIFN